MTTKRSARLARLLVVGVALTLVAACGSSGGSDGASAPTTTAAASATTAAGGDSTSSDGKVTVKGFAFEPKELQVKVGTTVTWTNDDPATHTATSDDGTFDTKSMKTGKTGTFTFAKAGTYKYHCNIHPTMTATVVVG